MRITDMELTSPRRLTGHKYAFLSALLLVGAHQPMLQPFELGLTLGPADVTSGRWDHFSSTLSKARITRENLFRRSCGILIFVTRYIDRNGFAAKPFLLHRLAN